MAEEIDVNELSAAQLKEYVKENNLDVKGATTRKEILAVLNCGKVEEPAATQGEQVSETKIDADDGATAQAYLDGPSIINVQPSGTPTSALSNKNPDGIFVTAERKRPVVEDDEKPKAETVALFSERNLHWQGVGELKKGYNIVTERAAEKWLTRNVVREVSARELARHYGK